MSADDAQQMPNFDTDQLYKVEMFTDQRTGSIRRMTPVDAEGNPDASRPVVYIGEAQAMTPAGALPLSFELKGDSMAEAAAGFAQGAEQALNDTVEELKRMQRESQNSIVMPGQGGNIDLPPGMGR